MIEPQDYSDSQSELEALLAGAGKIVRPSDDLRPRVLESARLAKYEQSMRLRIGQLALALVLLAGLTMSLRSSSDTAAPHSQRPVGAGALLGSEEAAMLEGESAWDAVDAFRELRRRHAKLLRLAM